MSHASAVSQVRPAVVGIIGSAVRAPEGVGDPVTRWVDALLASAPAQHRLAVLDAFFGTAQTLTHAFEEIGPGTVAPISQEIPPGMDFPGQSRAGVRDALRMLAEGGGSIERRKWIGYASGAVPDERYLACALTLVTRSVDLVDGLAAVTGMPVRQVWGLIKPNLLD